MDKPVKFRQMEYDRDGFGYGFLFTGGGILCMGMATIACSRMQLEGLFILLIALLILWLGLSIIVCYWRTLEFSEDEIRLKLGPILLRKIPLSTIRGMGRSEICPNIRGNPWKAEIIFLSFEEPTHIRGIERHRVTDAELAAIAGSEEEKEQYIMQKAMFLYFKDRGSSMSLNKTYGTWLEYTPERAAELKHLLPDAEYYID